MNLIEKLAHILLPPTLDELIRFDFKEGEEDERSKKQMNERLQKIRMDMLDLDAEIKQRKRD